MAINGSGFFAVQKPGTFTDGAPVFDGVDRYTRRGDFQLDKSGYPLGQPAPRATLRTMEGGTVFHFVTDGPQAALARARAAAQGKDVRVGGGVETVRQYLRERQIDYMHLAISPVLLGSGEHLLGGIDLVELGYRCTKHVASPNATHVVLERKG